MNVKLDYGDKGIWVNLPDEATSVIEPSPMESIQDETGAVRRALLSPYGGVRLRSIARKGTTAGISVCDVTRAQPRRPVLHALLEELSELRTEDVTIFIATGTHEGNSPGQIEEMLGKEIAGSFRVIVHDARDDSSLLRLPDVNSVSPVLINREWMECDLRITTGFVEPHFFAGFSGGPKMAAPGLAGLETVLELHNAWRIGHPQATWGVTEGNPIHDDIRAIAESVGVHFAVDVTINREKRITKVFAGELAIEHSVACKTAYKTAMQSVDAPCDVVLTSNSGYPLDQNLYQTVKGMSAAARIVKDGGVIICASECKNGVPSPSFYESFLKQASSPQDILDKINQSDRTVPDQWEAQIQAMIQLKAEVKLKSEGLSNKQIRDAHLTPVDDLNEAVKSAGKNATICVLPQGPQTIPYIAG